MLIKLEVGSPSKFTPENSTHDWDAFRPLVSPLRPVRPLDSDSLLVYFDPAFQAPVQGIHFELISIGQNLRLTSTTALVDTMQLSVGLGDRTLLSEIGDSIMMGREIPHLFLTRKGLKQPPGPAEISASLDLVAGVNAGRADFPSAARPLDG